MASVSIYKKYIYRLNPLLSCDAHGKQETPGFIGSFVCGNNTMAIYPLDVVFEARFPDPMTLCGGGDRTKHPQCAVPAPGATHPGVVMVDQYLYITQMDLL